MALVNKGSQLELQIDFPKLMIVTSSEITRHYFWFMLVGPVAIHLSFQMGGSESNFFIQFHRQFTQESVESHGEDLQGQ